VAVLFVIVNLIQHGCSCCKYYIQLPIAFFTNKNTNIRPTQLQLLCDLYLYLNSAGYMLLFTCSCKEGVSSWFLFKSSYFCKKRSFHIKVRDFVHCEYEYLLNASLTFFWKTSNTDWLCACIICWFLTEQCAGSESRPQRLLLAFVGTKILQ
jgi:hypothetical protein